jgi:hypothetical protein
MNSRRRVNSDVRRHNSVPMRLEVKAAFAIGILLPALETCRRGVSEWGVDFTTMFTDYLAGALLLIGAWAAYRVRSWGTLFLVVAWAWVTSMMSGSLWDQVEATLRNTSTEPHNFLVVIVKFLLWSICVLSLVFSFRGASHAHDAQQIVGRERRGRVSQLD